MALIEFDGVVFSTVEDLVKYKKLMANESTIPEPQPQQEVKTQQEVKPLQTEAPAVKTVFVQRKRTRRGGYTRTHWNAWEDQMAKEVYIKNRERGIPIAHMRIKTLCRTLNRTDKSVWARMNRMREEWEKDVPNPKGSALSKPRRTNKEIVDVAVSKAIETGTTLLHKKTKPRKRKHKRKGFDKSRQRMSFIHKEIKKTIALDNRISYEVAFKRASEKWQNQGIQVGMKVRDVFPKFRPLTKEGKNAFRTLLTNLCTGVLDKIDYGMVESSCPVNAGHKWNKALWSDLVTEFLRNVYDINQILGCQGKWRITMDSNNEVIRYGT